MIVTKQYKTSTVTLAKITRTEWDVGIVPTLKECAPTGGAFLVCVYERDVDLVSMLPITNFNISKLQLT